MRRGEIWTASGGSGYAGKPRPAVVFQDDRFAAKDSITICPLTSDPTEMSLFRPIIEPSQSNGLRKTSRVMADKVTTVPKTRLRDRVGRLSDEDMLHLDRALLVFLGLAG